MKENKPLNLILKNGQLSWGKHTFPCTWGKSGIIATKIEGDGATPIGSFPFLKVYYRPDRLEAPTTCLPVEALTPHDGWCDDPNDPKYNQFVSLPYPGRHEKLWREDHVYDIILVVNYNIEPIIEHKGSAIFVHLSKPDNSPTAGCVAFRQEYLLQVLDEASPKSCLIVEN